MIDRRRLLAAFLAAPVLAAQPSSAAAPIGGIRIVLSPAVREGWGARAGLIAAELQRQLAAALGPRLTRGAGTTLVVTVETIQLAAFAGSGGGRRSAGGQNTDYFQSRADLVGPGNRVLGSWPVLSAVNAGAAGSWYLPDIDQRRLRGLAAHNAGWIARYALG